MPAPLVVVPRPKRRRREPPAAEQLPLFAELGSAAEPEEVDESAPVAPPPNPWPEQSTRDPRAITECYAQRWPPNQTATYKAFHALKHGPHAEYPSGKIPLPAVARHANLSLRTVKTYKERLIAEKAMWIVEQGGFRKGPSTYELAFVSLSPQGLPGGKVERFPDQSPGARRAHDDQTPGANFAPELGANAPEGQSVSQRVMQKEVSQRSRLTDDKEPGASQEPGANLAPARSRETDSEPASELITNQPTGWKPTAEDVETFAKFIFDHVHQYDKGWSSRLLKTAVRARSVDEVIKRCRQKMSPRNPPRSTGWFLSVISEHFGLQTADHKPVDAQTVMRVAAEKFGGKIPKEYQFWLLAAESPQLAMERLETWPD